MCRGHFRYGSSSEANRTEPSVQISPLRRLQNIKEIGFPLTGALVQEVGEQTSHNRLVTDDQDVLLPLQLHDDGLQALDQVLVRLRTERVKYLDTGL